MISLSFSKPTCFFILFCPPVLLRRGKLRGWLSGWLVVNPPQKHHLFKKTHFSYGDGGLTPKQAVQRCSGLHPWRQWKPYWTRPWATCSVWPWSEQGLGLDGLQGCLPASASLWFHGSVKCCHCPAVGLSPIITFVTGERLFLFLDIYKVCINICCYVMHSSFGFIFVFFLSWQGGFFGYT